MRWPRVGSRRILLACAAIAGARLVLFLLRPDQPTDFDQLWWAARALIDGEDPYRSIARGTSPYPLYYPLPAVLLALPFSALPLPFARVAWDIVIGWTLAAALSRRPPYALLALASGAYVHAMVRGQVTPLLVAAVLMPMLGWLLAIKPNIGLALWAGYPSRLAAASCAGLVALSLVVFPSWPVAMWHAVQVGGGHIKPPILMPFGWILLAAALRWRTPEGRLLAALALLPHHLQPYETLVLCLVPRSRGEMAVFVVGTWIALTPLLAGPHEAAPDLQELGRRVWPWLLAGVYLPMLGLVLRGPSPAPEPGRDAVASRESPP